jgi:hypothetical protein
LFSNSLLSILFAKIVLFLRLCAGNMTKSRIHIGSNAANVEGSILFPSVLHIYILFRAEDEYRKVYAHQSTVQRRNHIVAQSYLDYALRHKTTEEENEQGSHSALEHTLHHHKL